MSEINEQQEQSILIIENKGYANLISNISKKEFLNLNNKQNLLMKSIIEANNGRLIRTTINLNIALFNISTDALISSYIIKILTDKINDSLKSKSNKFNLKMLINTGEIIIKNDYISGKGMLEIEKMKKLDCFSLNIIGLSQNTFELIDKNIFYCNKVHTIEPKNENDKPLDLYILNIETIKNIIIHDRFIKFTDQIIETTKNPVKSSKPMHSTSKNNIPSVKEKVNLRKKVLIVDDAKIMRILLRQIIEKNNIANAAYIEEACDCDEGYIKFKNFKPDIVTLDIEMPSSGKFENGIGVLKQILSEQKDANIVMISASASKNKVRESIMSGAKDFIIKPFNEERVVNTILRILNKN